MSGSGSETPLEVPDGEAPFVEHDDRTTRMPFDEGGVPLYIALLWAAFIVAYLVVMSLVALPDLRAWLAR